tara:strand:+ start:532 stop:819 length:288 start_codon:yes stop_codon:yes gene_type:complete
MIQKERVVEELETIMDPEIGLDIYTLGLIYDIIYTTEEEITIVMTYTTPLCPFGPLLQENIETALKALGFGRVIITLTFDPPWQPPDNLREMMGV